MRGRFTAGLLVVAAVVAAGCGAESHPNEPPPPAPLELSAKIDDRNVVVVPDAVGAGLVNMTISNQSADDVQLAFDGPTNAQSPEIPAGGVGSVQFQLETGDYTVEPSISTITPTRMAVGEERPGSQNILLLP
jgi:hypothetical protein